jgi:hypothetical protein
LDATVYRASTLYQFLSYSTAVDSAIALFAGGSQWQFLSYSKGIRQRDPAVSRVPPVWRFLSYSNGIRQWDASVCPEAGYNHFRRIQKVF